MSRIRNVKPEFFRHEGLQDLEQQHPGKYPMFVFEGLWTKCDRQGVFEWKPRTLKLDILPFLPFEMEEVLGLLAQAGYIKKYAVDGKLYGFIPSFLKHQKISAAEEKNRNLFPMPTSQAETLKSETLSEPFQNGFETVLKPFQNPGNSENGNSENGNSENGNSEGANAPKECVFSKERAIADPEKLFLHIWQTTPGNIFNSLARIESPKEWAVFWSQSPPSCEEVKRILHNVIADVTSGALERRFIPKTPDRFVLNGGFNRHQQRFRGTKQKQIALPPTLTGKVLISTALS